MGYRHHIGYIPTKDLPEVMQEVNRLKSLIGSPKEDNPDDTYSMYDVTTYLQDHVILILNLGKLYFKNTEDIYNLLYKDKGDDYSNEDTEFFFTNNKELLLDISFAQMKVWSELMEKWQKIIDKVINQQNLEEQDYFELLDISKLFEQETLNYKASVRMKNRGTDPEWCKPYTEWQFNYAAVENFQKYIKFDAENNILCVYAY